MDKISSAQLTLYLSLFKGRLNTYARRWEKGGRSGYSPAYDVDWTNWNVFKAEGGLMKDYPDKTLMPFDLQATTSHLIGSEMVGIYPLLDNNTSYFIAADFDEGSWKKDAKSFYDVCQKHDIPVYLEISRSGNGCHAWIFFESPILAAQSRALVLNLIGIALNHSQFEKEVSFDRLFPNQDYLGRGGFGNLIALPLNGKSLEEGTSCFVDPKSFKPYPDQWRFLTTIQKLATKEFSQKYQESCAVNDVSVVSGKSKKLRLATKSQIEVSKSALTPQLTSFIREQLNFINSQYVIKTKIGKSTYGTERYFKLFNETPEKLLLPRGFLPKLTVFCSEKGISFTTIEEHARPKQIPFKSTISLRPHQEEAIKAADESDCGIIISPPGSGKTIIGLEIITKRQLPALIIVHRKQLLDQWIERIEAFLGIPKKEIGQFSGIKKKLGKQITVAMVQSLERYKDLSELENTFGTIIVDECHHMPALTFRSVITRFNPQYLYGLTATMMRKYNDEKMIPFYLGETLIEINSTQKLTNQDSTPLTTVTVRETDFLLPFNYKTDRTEIFLKSLIYDTNRNQMIIQDVLEGARLGYKSLVLTERKEHIEILKLYLKKECEIVCVSGDDSAVNRKLKLAQIKAGNFQVVISTGQYMGEGIDIVNLNCLFLVFPLSFEGKLVQYIGRIQRSNGMKQVYDYRDSKVDYLERQFKQREKYYRKMEARGEKTLNTTLSSLFEVDSDLVLQ